MNRGLLLRGALDVDAVDRRDGHVDRELDRVVRPRQRLGGLHLLGHLLHASLEVWVVEEAAETFHGLNCTGGRAPAARRVAARAGRATARRRPRPPSWRPCGAARRRRARPGRSAARRRRSGRRARRRSRAAGSTPKATNAPIMPPSTPPTPPGSGSVLASMPTK